jgi:hypothetical protein
MIRNKQIIRRKIHALQQRTGTEDGVNASVTFPKEFFYPQSDTCW